MDLATAWRQYIEEADSKASPAASADTVSNGSFETGAGNEPEGWHLVSGAVGASTEWPASGGVDGGRCLRISPKGGGASWRCDPVSITGGADYLFRCAMKREGNRHWAHACEISWVSLVFRDAAGRPCKAPADAASPFILVRCRKTADWVEGFRCLHAPRDARTLHIGFRIKRGEPKLDDAYGFRKFWHADIDTGQWWVDDVRLERMPLDTTPAKGRLTIRVPGGCARLRVVNGEGKTFAPAGTATYTWGGGCFHPLREYVSLLLEPGAYQVEAMHGFQRKPFHQTANIAEGASLTTTIELPRIPGAYAEGWYEGDHHNHLSFHGDTRHPLMMIDDVCRIARGEGLDFLSFCGEIVDQHAYADWRAAGCPDDQKPDGAVETEDFVCSVGHEVTQDLLGHVCLINPPGRVEPGHPWWIAPTDAAVVEWMRRGNGCLNEGAVVMAHPYDSLTSDNLFDVLADASRTGLHRELPVDAALGLADTMDFLAVEEPADLELRFRDYARLLNLGLRIGVSGASDAYADQGTEIVGSLRTVVRADAFTMKAIARGYRQQKTIATNGPILRLAASGAAIGDTVAGPAVHVAAWAYSNWGLSRLEILAADGVVADASPGPDGWAAIDAELTFERSQWLIARAWGPGHSALNLQSVPAGAQSARGQWAVSSPIHVRVAGKPLIPRREDAQYFVRWIDACCEAIRARKAFLEGKGPYGPDMQDAHVTAALDLFARGRKFYQRLL